MISLKEIQHIKESTNTRPERCASLQNKSKAMFS